MAASYRAIYEETMTETVDPYVCKVSNATFTKRCTVKECFANVDNLNKAGVNVEAITGCAYVDFHMAGFAENLDYAVEEQGFVGYRDLQYMAPFFKTQSIKLRDIYTNNVELFRKSVALLWAIKNNGHGPHCEKCGHPLRPGSFQCTSTTMCDERKYTAMEVLTPFLSILNENEIVKACNAICKSLNEKHSPRIALSPEEIEKLQDLRIEL